VGLVQGPLSLTSTIQEPSEIRSGSSGLEIREYTHRDPSRRLRGTLYPQKLAPTCSRSVGFAHELFYIEYTEITLMDWSKEHKLCITD
jgi:hypothetical protein